MSWSREICRTAQALRINMCPTNHRAQFSNPSIQEKALREPGTLCRVLRSGQRRGAKVSPSSVPRAERFVN